jgi:creatinine amidohydrolase/Fe(II)-dependent formamide hydrolase-like protein/7-cyano-7-deazaguanine synthase in queuosine biosynthesis
MNAQKKSSSKDDALSLLRIFDRLEVGPVKLQRRRLIAPYRVSQKGGEDTFDLIYSYEEDVFDPSDEACQNLASMIAAQLAINYGLFCSSIVFHGSFDQKDRRLIRDMAENTAREIYAKKFLEPNPFLVREASQLRPERRKSYLQADLQFPQGDGGAIKPQWHLWSTDKKRHCILSSGGKDSLLSYGLLNEMGVETHPVFVNESGRHWFTALNAFRFFKQNVPNTSRVWVNSDRLFAWMLRHMPFIRPDFAAIRSDEYPIRLWTVAVFLFGALPLVRKRGIGRIVIGDEYDTTNRTSHEGITHYDGLYDQSRYFDDALSRYYMQKGWAVSQFSVLRPLSEMLIEKILVQRYPHLQEQQISCHATHQENDRMHPCGKCEKCRRVVGMLKAIDADPKRCGYTERQIESCLKDLTSKGVLQEVSGSEHLHFMLSQKGLIDLPQERKKMAKEHPVILKLRFNRERSPIDGIPVNLRQPLYRIFLEHAPGAVRRVEGKWMDFDPISDPSINRSYPFELTPDRTPKTSSKVANETPKQSYLWAELTWPEAEKRFKEVDIALLPIGSIEQHGPHLPLDTDAFDAEYLARRVAEACSQPRPLVLPLVSFGVSYHHEGFKGTISISNDTLSRLIYEIGMSVAKNGINKLVIINAHGGNTPALNHAAQMINRDARIFACVETGETSDVDISKLIETPNDVHAGEFETSTSLAVRPHLVQMDKAGKKVPSFSSRYLNFSSKRAVSWYAHTKKISPTGVMGDPTKASAEKGKRIWEIMIAHLVAFVEDLKGMTLEEIYQKRY